MMFTIGEMFAVNPIPQGVLPIVESYFNYDTFYQGPIIPLYMQNRLPEDQYRHTTSPTMIELAKLMPKGLETKFGGKINSPQMLQHLWEGYLGTLGAYALEASDFLVRHALDYPLPPAKHPYEKPIIRRFYKGETPPRPTWYEKDFYAAIEKATAVAGSLRFAKQTGNIDRYLQIHKEDIPYIVAAPALENIREQVRNLRYAQQMNWLSDKSQEEKQKIDDDLQTGINKLIETGWKFRPGGEFNVVPEVPKVGEEEVSYMIDYFGIDDSEAYKRRLNEDFPDTEELLDMVTNTMNEVQLRSLVKAGNPETPNMD
jgi:hypothetical protein